MMKDMIAFCGLNCSICPTFLATKKDDDTAREQTAAMINKNYGFSMTAEDINCDGCKSTTGCLISYCQACEVRKCGMEKGLEDCTVCKEQPCETLAAFHTFSPEAKKAFDALLQKNT